MSHARQRRWASVLVLPLLLVPAACGGGGADPKSDQEANSSAPTTSATPEAPAVTYLPAPDDVDLTEPGTQLALGEDAFAAWTPRQDLVGVVQVNVASIAQVKKKAAFEGFQLPAGVTPYFVTSAVTNVGDTDLGGRQLPIYLVDSTDSLLAPSGIARDFKPCPGSTLPAVFGPGKQANSCLVFLLDPGVTPTAVTFRPPEGVVPLTWSGETTVYGQDKNKNGKKNKQNKPSGPASSTPPTDAPTS